MVPFQPGRRPYQSTRVIFEARIVGGELGTLEVDGTTDFAEWGTLEEAAQVPESAADIIRVGIEAWRAQPAR